MASSQSSPKQSASSPPDPAAPEDREFDHFKSSSSLLSSREAGQQWSPVIGPVYISASGLSHLVAYKYRSGLSGFLDRVVMTPFWEWAVTLMPSWLAPNLITVVSLLCASFAYLLLAWHTPGMRGSPPAWAFLLAALFMFLYQTLDAIDGKQARRTGSSSPLGQLFDHGCDAICAVFHGLFLSSTLNSGASVLSLLCLMFAIVPFFVSNWEEASTHFMRFGIIGVTEAQFSSMGVLAATGLLGSGIWDYRPLDLLSMRAVFVLVGCSGLLYQCCSSAVLVWHHLQQPGATAFDRRQALASIGQFALFLLLSALCVLSPSRLFSLHPELLLWLIGLLSAYQVSRLIICHVTMDPYPAVFRVLYPLPLLTLWLWWKGAEEEEEGEEGGLQAQLLFVWLYVAVLAVCYAHFVYVSINQITHFLGIHCFRIKARIIQSTSGPVAEPG